MSRRPNSFRPVCVNASVKTNGTHLSSSEDVFSIVTSQQRVMSERSVVMVEEDESSKKELVMAQTTRGEELGPLDHK